MNIRTFGKKKGFKPSKQQIVEFLHSLELGSIATVSPEGFPETATVAFSETDKLEIIIGTDNRSRKANNIQNNPKAAFVATDSEKRFTVQLHGYAQKFSEKSNQQLLNNHYEKLLSSRPFKDIPGQSHIILKPIYLKFSDCNLYPYETTEFSFENNEE